MESNRYQWDAEAYARHSSEQFSWALDLIHQLDLDGHENILDLGCGDGKITALLAEQQTTGKVVGVDSSWHMVSQASRNYGKISGVGLQFLQMDAAALGFQEGFHIIFSNAMMHWVHDHLAVLRGVYRSLVPGGFCLLQMGGQGNAAQMVHVLSHVKDSPRWRDFFTGFRFPYKFHGVDTYRSLLSDSGLFEVRLELIEKDMQHPGFDELAGWLRTAWLPYNERVPGMLREKFISEVAELYKLEFPPDSDGVIHVPMVRLEVEAERH
jgi:trans-aconitate methyltransferase